MKKLVLILVLLPALALAGERGYNEGMTYKEQDGVIVIDYSSSYTQKRLEREAKASGEKSKKQWQIIENQRKSNRHYGRSSAPRGYHHPTPSQSGDKAKRIADKRKQLKEIRRGERESFMSQQERDWTSRRAKRIKREIKEIQRE